ncbi:hypothetical protein Dimus_005776 [Dionaea muscipula]
MGGSKAYVQVPTGTKDRLVSEARDLDFRGKGVIRIVSLSSTDRVVESSEEDSVSIVKETQQNQRDR